MKKAQIHDVEVIESKIKVDGVLYQQRELARKLGVTSTIIYNKVSRSTRPVVLAIQELLWELENTKTTGRRVYKCNGYWITADEVKEIAQIHISSAHRRCRDWESGLYTNDQLLSICKKEPGEPFKQNRGNWTLGEMQPRGDVRAMKTAGRWERDLPQPEDGCGCGTLGRGGGMLAVGIAVLLNP